MRLHIPAPLLTVCDSGSLSASVSLSGKWDDDIYLRGLSPCVN